MVLSKRVRWASLVLCIAAFCALCIGAAVPKIADLTTHDELKTELDTIRNQHNSMITSQAVTNEHLKSIDEKLLALEQNHVIERITKNETTNDTNTKFLIAIMISLALLIVERVMTRISGIPRNLNYRKGPP